MDKDDENYPVMQEHLAKHVKMVLIDARKNGVEVSEWEIDEIELAFEAAFTIGFRLGKKMEFKRKIFPIMGNR